MLKRLTLTTSFLVFAPISAVACSCVQVPSSPEQHLEFIDVAFSGEAIGKKWVLDFAEGVRLLQSTRFRVRSGLKGVEEDDLSGAPVIVEVRHERGEVGGCGFIFHTGLNYQVFATINDNKNYTSICHFSVIDELPPRFPWDEYRRAYGKEE